MRKAIIVLSIVVLIADGCGRTNKKPERTENSAIVEETQDKIVFDSDETKNIIEYDTEITILENVDTLMIDYSYCKTNKGVKQIAHYDSEYSKYGITKLNTETSEDTFVYDDMSNSFSIIAKVKLYDNIHSLVIRGRWEDLTRIWLVHYDKNNIQDGFYSYIDNCLIGYYYDDIGEGWINSVVYIISKPYIERTTDSWGNVEENKIEILKSGELKVTQTVHSKYEI